MAKTTKKKAPQKTKVAILGGGLGAMTTAFMLTNRPELQARYDITIYQMGWRLGGKGASGRNMDYAKRIEEHGPHFFMGFYANAFWLMQKCYRDLGRPPQAPLAGWQDAFKPHSQITLLEQVNGTWSPWPVVPPPVPGTPGFPNDDEIPSSAPPVTIWELISRLLDWMAEFYDRLPLSLRVFNLRPYLDPAIHVGKTLAVRFLSGLSPILDPVVDHLVGWLGEFVDFLDSIVGKHLAGSDNVRHLWIVLRLAAAIAIGLVLDHVPTRGFNHIDNYDLRDWLAKHGAPREAVWSAPIQSFYDLVFAYEKGDTRRPNLAAGTALRGILRMLLDYRGAFMWKMQAGMGETIFAPLYQVLKQRDVKFRFFHKVDNLVLSRDTSSIDAIEMTRQAVPKPAGTEGVLADGEYDPLVHVKGLPCFPTQPDFRQLQGGDIMEAAAVSIESAWTDFDSGDRITLTRGTCFDEVVLGISLGGVRDVAKELIHANTHWRHMVDRVQTVQTQHMQLWLNLNDRELGWDGPERRLFGSYVQPWNTVTDMTQVRDREDFPPAAHAESIAYSCGPFQDAPVIPPPGPNPVFVAEQMERVKAAALDFVRNHIAPIWPGALDPHNPNGLNWDVLVDLNNQVGVDRFDSQFFRPNIDPSERYVLSVVNSTSARLRASDSKFRHLTLAGDWTFTGMNAGCAEAAVMSGMEAARKISGYPFHIVGEHDV